MSQIIIVVCEQNTTGGAWWMILGKNTNIPKSIYDQYDTFVILNIEVKSIIMRSNIYFIIIRFTMHLRELKRNQIQAST